MTKDLRERLEEQWPALAARLRGFLVRKGVRPARREDIVQETATRLISMWHAVDHDRDPWPLVKTIALNLVRDEARRRYEELPSELPDLPLRHDAERALMAHLELARVREALEGLSPAHRSVLLAEAGEACSTPRGSDAEKMMRMRARKNLKELMKKLPGLLPLRLRLLDAGQLFTGLRDLALPGIACVACFSLIPIPLAPPRGLYGSPDSLPGEMAQMTAIPAISDIYLASSLTEDLAALRAGQSASTAGTDRPVSKGSSKEDGDADTPLPGVPEAPEEVPTVEGVPVVSPAETEPPEEVPLEAPVPDAPGVPVSAVPIMVDPIYQALDPSV